MHHVMRDPFVMAQMKLKGLTEENAHDIVKSIMIVTVRDLKIDINKLINQSSGRCKDAQE